MIREIHHSINIEYVKIDLMIPNRSASVSLPLHVRVQCARICTFREKSCSKGEDLDGTI